MYLAFSLADPADFFTFITGLALLMKKLAEINRYHSLRVFILTMVLSCIVMYCFFLFTFGAPPEPAYDGADHFTLSEI